MVPIYFFRISSGKKQGTGGLDLVFIVTDFKHPLMPAMKEIRG